MFERDLITQMRQWSRRSPHKPLVIRGARQVGKGYGKGLAPAILSRFV